MPLRSAVIVGDLLRPNGDGSPGGVDRAVQWLFDAIKRQVHLAASCPVELLATHMVPELAAWIASLRTPAEADDYWAQNHDDTPHSETLERLVVSRLRGRFCIGYELSPWLVRLLDGIGVPYVDIRLHPVRFMDDLMFSVRASDPTTQDALLRLAVPETEIIATAGLRQAMGHFISEARVPANTLLVAGQRRFDSTQIVAGRFFDAADSVAEIHAVCARYDAVVLKPHPLDRHHSLLMAACAAPTQVLGVIDDNIYRLMALPQFSGVLTVNSGVAQEAPYFSKRVHTLAPAAVRPLWRESGFDSGSHVSLTDFVLTPDFWRMVLGPHRTVSALDGMRLPPKPNRLRIALDSFWNYQQIDTDRIPRSAGA